MNSREDRHDRAFTVERGSGIVAAKTMPPNAEGIVDILMLYVVMPIEDGDHGARDQIIQHTAAHEAVHATIHHLGTEPFDVHKREEFGFATLQFIGMASEQIEEHLAEYLSSRIALPLHGTTAEDLAAAFTAWIDTIEVQLSAIPKADPEYFTKGMVVSFEALHTLWKALAYFAAELRTENNFGSVPDDIRLTPAWRRYVAPWWNNYIHLLGRIPMTVQVDIPATDIVVQETPAHLQRWALGVGFDFHDTSNGG